MSRATKVVLVLLLVFVVASLSFVGGFAVSRFVPRDVFSRPSAATQDMNSKLLEVESLLQKDALRPPNEASATAGAIQGLVSSNGDRYATYFSPKQYKSFKDEQQGSFGGVGIVLGTNDAGTARVMQVYPSTPAEKAGIKPGDVFVAINGQRKPVWTPDQVAGLVRGPEGTTVTVTMSRATSDTPAPVERTFTLKRARIVIPNIKTAMYGDVGYIRLGEFNANAARDAKKAVEEITAKGAKAIVFDVRENPGGLLDQAVDVSALFLGDKKIVTVAGRNTPEEVLSGKPGSKITDLPLFVLVDGHSASASEILAAAIQDYDRGKLVGEKTYGKETVQSTYSLGDGSGVKFTIAQYLSPKRRKFDGIGLVPDFVVVMDPLKQLEPKTDTQLQQALNLARQAIAAKVAGK
jgi:carboxyl-terminal processing protease